MQITLNKQTALALLRLERARRGKEGVARRTSGLIDPDSSPHASWTKRTLDELADSLGLTFDGTRGLDVCVSGTGKRVRSKFVSNTIYSGDMPDGAFSLLQSNIAVSSPELLFVELGNDLTFAEHLLLGFELTGSYSLDPYRGIEGHVTFEIPPATNVERIRSFLDSSWHLNGSGRARRTLALLADNAWSPFEAITATMMTLPWEEYGYGFGRCVLNKRIWTPEHLLGSSQKESRVPDVLIEGTHVGINYDGNEHMDLGKIADAGVALGRDPGNGHIARELQWALEKVRGKYVDDGRRSRELSADGYTVYPVFKEDLYQFGGLDRTMMQVMEALKQRDKWDTREYQRILQMEFARKERQALLQSLLPGKDLELTGDVEEAFVKLPRRSPSQKPRV